LRHRGELAVVGNGDPGGKDMRKPCLEVLLHPFGWVVIATVDVLVAPQPAGVDMVAAVSGAVAAAEECAVEATVGKVRFPGTLGNIAATVADGLAGAELLGGAGSFDWLPTHRVLTVIDADVSGTITSMPRVGTLLSFLHTLSRGGVALGSPPYAFVPRWTGLTFGWAPDDLVYSGNHGTSVILSTAAGMGDGQESTSHRHRRLTLLLAHVSASAALVQAATQSSSIFLREWGRVAAYRLGRLYGPYRADYQYWGLEAQQFIRATGTGAFAQELRDDHRPLEAQYPLPSAYP
jgi:hypothetical protein